MVAYYYHFVNLRIFPALIEILQNISYIPQKLRLLVLRKHNQD